MVAAEKALSPQLSLALGELVLLWIKQAKDFEHFKRGGRENSFC